jgi:SPP1 family predicted phage head-tail adaptor
MSGAPFKFRVQLLRHEPVKDSFGQRSKQLVPINVGTPDNRLWCSVVYPSGIEMAKAGSEASIVRASIRIRYRDGIDAGMHADVDGRLHEIEAVLPDAQRAFINLTAKVVNLKT